MTCTWAPTSWTAQLTLEPWPHVHHDQDLPAIHQRLDLPQVGNRGYLTEVGGPAKPSHEFPGRRAAALVVHGKRNIRDVKRGCVPEDQKLHQRRDHDHQPALRIHEDRQELLDHQTDQSRLHLSSPSPAVCATDVVWHPEKRPP